MHARHAGLCDDPLRQGRIGKSQVRYAIQISDTPLADDFVGVSLCISHGFSWLLSLLVTECGEIG